MEIVDIDPIESLDQRRDSGRRHPFGLLGMEGSYPLTHAAIDRAIDADAPGNFALGYQDGTTFLVFYVGCSETDVRAALHEWVGAPTPGARIAPSAQAPWSMRAVGSLALAMPALAAAGAEIDGAYTHFAYSYASSAQTAFAKACRNYEDFGGARGLDNAAHPAELRRRDAADSFVLHAVRTRACRPVPGWRVRG